MITEYEVIGTEYHMGHVWEVSQPVRPKHNAYTRILIIIALLAGLLGSCNDLNGTLDKFYYENRGSTSCTVQQGPFCK